MNKTIYMCYKTLPEIEHHSINWKILNPDWNIELYDDNLCKQFLLKEYSQLYVDIFNFLKDGPIKADFWRICILNKYGGLYVDADIEPIKSLSEYIKNDNYFVTCISCLTPSYHMNPHIIFSHKNNEILETCINIYIDFFNNNKPYEYWEWSIVTIFNSLPIFQRNIKKKGSQIIIINNKKYTFIQEEDGAAECSYNGNIVLKNKYKYYINHKFMIDNFIKII